MWPRIREDSGDLGCGGRAFERPLARRHLEQHRSECEYVSAAIRSGPLQLLGRHVRNGSNNSSGNRGRRGDGLVGLLVVGERPSDRLLGDSEVEQLRAVLREHDVRGFQVAVDNPDPMSRNEAFSNGDRDGEQFIQAERPAS